MVRQINPRLSELQKKILLEKGTEVPFSGQYVDQHGRGMFACANCGAQLFASDTKFDSGSGWPSFYDVANQGAVKLSDDTSHGMQRVEVTCSTCGGHLGHLFDDAHDQPTGQRYCINSAALQFMPTDKAGEKNKKA